MNAGVTHPLAVWLDALAEGGRMLIPLTVRMDAHLGKGPMIRIVRGRDGFAARVQTMVAIYSAIGLRDEVINAALGRAMATQPFPALTRLRRDAHEPASSCWLHTATCCFAM